MSAYKKGLSISLRKGIMDMLPLSLAVLPWGILFGSIAVQRGFSWLEAQLFSAIIFGGAVQIVTVELIADNATLLTILFTAFVGQAILLEASLSYLGLGVQEPTPAWGLMLQGGAEEYAESAPWIAIFPGIAISLAVFGFNLLGDAIRDILDPKLREQ